MKFLHEHLRRKDSDEPIPDLQSDNFPRRRDLDYQFVKLTVKAGELQRARLAPLLPFGPHGGESELLWVIEIESKSQMVVVREERKSSLLAAIRVDSPSELIDVLRAVLISKGRPTRITCDPGVISVIRDWARIYGVDVVTRRGQLQRRTAQTAQCSDDNTKRGCELFAITAEEQHKVQNLAKKTVACEMPVKRERKVGRTG